MTIPDMPKADGIPPPPVPPGPRILNDSVGRNITNEPNWYVFCAGLSFGCIAFALLFRFFHTC